MTTAVCAAFGAILSSPRRSMASVASAPGRVKRVAVLKSRSSSQRACDGGLATVGGRQRHRGGAAQDRSGERAARPRRARGRLRRAPPPPRRPAPPARRGRPGVGSVDRLLEAVDVRRARLADLGGRGALVTRQDLDPRSAQPAAGVGCGLPRLRRREGVVRERERATVATRAAMMGRRRRIGERLVQAEGSPNPLRARCSACRPPARPGRRSPRPAPARPCRASRPPRR